MFQKEYELKKGDCVALLVENCPEFIGLWLGLAKIGVVAALINTNLKNQQLVHTIRSSSTKVLVYYEDLESCTILEKYIYF